MPEIKLKIDDLDLDHDNPRISHAEGQQEALQKIVKDQKAKLVKLAESIADHGLNPMDRLLVLRLNRKPARFVSLEGNRRIAVFKMLTNPAVMSGLEMPAPMKRTFERLASDFRRGRFEPLPCFELSSREEARYWLSLRHNVGHEGAGVDNWSTMAKRRFDGKPPAVQALELVTERAGLTQSELASITDKFPTSTLERFLENRAVRRELGFDVKAGKIVTRLPADEIARPLKKIILDLASKRTRVGALMRTDDMLKYVREDLGDALPALSKARAVERTLDAIPTSEFTRVRTSTPRRKPDPSDRKEVVPRSCRLNVTHNRLAEIYKELRTLKLDDAPNAVAVLLRVFLELSLDRFLETHGRTLRFIPPGGREIWKPLDKKLAEAVEVLVDMGVSKNRFTAITRSLKVQSSPMNTELLHLYVHDQFATPLRRELTAAWDHAQPLFEHIWP